MTTAAATAMNASCCLSGLCWLSSLQEVARLYIVCFCSHAASCACSGGRDPPAPRASQAEAVALQTLPDSVPNPTRLRISPSMAHIGYSALPGLTSSSSQQSGSHELEATSIEAAGGHPLQVPMGVPMPLCKRGLSVSQKRAIEWASATTGKATHGRCWLLPQGCVRPISRKQSSTLSPLCHLQGGCFTRVSVLPCRWRSSPTAPHARGGGALSSPPGDKLLCSAAVRRQGTSKPATSSRQACSGAGACGAPAAWSACPHPALGSPCRAWRSVL